ncbi:MAG TPA: ATP-binding protein [Usitatibacter sp.]|jgi:signal transduction histidine kinase/CheY-like chemotaxis protein|nr:ATP-binding protein [Usitatibacter sp.]
MMWSSIRSSIRRKVILVVMATTVSALLLSAIGLSVYDLRAYERQSTNDLTLQAEILARASAPALQFDDRDTAANDLKLVRVRPNVLQAAIYRQDGQLFATYARTDAGALPDFPPHPLADGYRIEGDQLVLFRRVVENGEPLGTMYLRARYLPWNRLRDYLTIIGVVMVASVALAALLSGWLQSTITGPILEVARVARDVMEKRDYSLRARKTTEDEIGELVDSFNGMIADTGRRADALSEADQRKDEFLATLAHELRNPLAPLRNAVEILRMPGSTPQMATRALEMMDRQLLQMVRLVDDLLDVSRITTGKLMVRRSTMVLQDALRDAVDTVKTFLDAREHSLEVRLAAEPLAVEGDRTRLAQVFSNLLHNAGKYTEPGGHIVLSLEREGDAAVVRVADNGLGIETQSRETIFDMFVQVDRSLTRTQAGLGVGLTLARRLVALHQGNIAATSDGLGRGSVFTVRIPVSGAAPDAAGLAPAAEVAAPRRRILIADDNVDFANSLASLLTARGHDVRAVHDGAEALRVAAEFLPEFAFLDIGMPKVHGYEVARRLKAGSGTAGCVLVAVTGWGQEDDRRRARDAGFDRHLVKPIDPSQLELILARRGATARAS